MKSIPKVTVGIPVYNGEHFIRTAVMSVLHQSYVNLELIITDDGSKDSTIEILSSIKDPRLIVISDGENKGIAYRLNQQIDLAQGEYFIRMDADDIMFPWRIEKEVEYLDNYSNVDVVGASAIVIGNENELLGKRLINSNAFSADNDYFIKSRFIHPTVAGRTKWFRKWKYRAEMSGNEDLDLWIRSHKESSFGDIEEPLLFYRDPYLFRLKTYISRQKKYFRCIWALRVYMSNKWFIPKCVIRSIIATTAALVLSVLGKEEIMISRRNRMLDEQEKEYFKKVLNKLV